MMITEGNLRSKLQNALQYQSQQLNKTLMRKTKINSGNQTTFPQRQLQSPLLHDHDDDPFQQSYAQSVVSQVTNPQLLLQFFKQYKPHHSSFKINKLKHSQYLKLKKYKNSVYYGQFINAKKQGSGIMIYDNGRVYEGQWECDFRHGQGFQKFANSCSYEGQYINGKPEGVGKYKWPNGQFYEGQWINGIKEGHGMWQGAKGDEYVGQWKLGKAEGYGVHKWINGDMYEGQFKQCLKHGEGVQRFANGDIYRGNYANGKPTGFGQYYWKNGSYFKGKFQNGLREGNGFWKKGPGNCDRYEGGYLNDKKSGFGIFHWSSGNVYKGNYENDQRNGYGEMFWNDGTFYKGQWKNGIQQGEGETYVPGQGYKKGFFQDNTLMVVQYESSITNQTKNLPTETHQTPIKIIKKFQTKPPEKQEKVQKKKPNTFNLNIRKRGFSSKNYKTIKSNDQTILNYRYKDYKPEKHPLLPKKPQKQKRYESLDPNIKTLQNVKKDRILHSSFFMHKLHNRATTSVHKSREKVSNVASGLDENEENRIDIFEEMKTFKRNKKLMSSRNAL